MSRLDRSGCWASVTEAEEFDGVAGSDPALTLRRTPVSAVTNCSSSASAMAM